MTTWRRVGLSVMTIATVLAALARPTAAATKKPPTTTTTVIRSPMDEPIGSKTIVNSWAVAPAGQSQDPTQPSERPYFTYSVVPGKVIEDAIVLYNYSNVPLNFRLYATDAINNAEGGFDVLASGTKPKDVGTWITVAQESVDLPAKTQARIPVTVRVPNNALPGDHVGAVLASSVAIGTGPDGKVVNVDRRTGTRVYLRVAGPVTPELSITQVHDTYHASLNPFSGKLDVSYRVENTGNVRLAGKHRVAVSGVFGLGQKETKYEDVPELLPGQGITMKASFKGVPATFVDFATARIDPDNVEGKDIGVVKRRGATVAIPWTLLALALVVYLIFYSRRNYRRHAEVPVEPAPRTPQPV